MGEMGEFERCYICKRWGWSNTHRCGPYFYVRTEDDDPEDAVRVFASSPGAAAERHLAENYDDYDYPKEYRFLVRDSEGTADYVIDVFVEQVPSFTSTTVETNTGI